MNALWGDKAGAVCPLLHFTSDEINRKIDRRRSEIDENQSQRRSLEQEVHELREKKVK